MSEAVKECWESVTSHVNSRFTNPFFGAFIVSWGIYNWDKLALLFFGLQSVDSRVSTFKKSVEWLDVWHSNVWDTLWWPLILSCSYLLISPYLHLAIQQIQKHSDKLRYVHKVDQDVDKELDRGRLVKATAKANLQDKVAEDEVRAEIENSVARTKILQEQAAVSEARRKLVEEKYLEAQEKARELKLNNESLARKEAKKEQEAKKATFAFEKSKAEHENELLTLRLPLVYQYLNALSDSLSQDGWSCSLSNLSDIIATVFGYESFEALLNDESFSAKNIKKIKYLSYDSETLFDCLNGVIESENEEHYESTWLFEHIQMSLDQYSLQLLDLDSVAEEAIEELWDTVYSELLEAGAVNSEMAITNAHFEDMDDLHKVSHQWVPGDGLYIKYSCILSGENDPDKMFYGDTIYVDFEVKHPLVIGESGLGAYEMYEVKARGKDYSDESD
ncbi:cell envelope integrity protein TolA [Vibrio diabolicus]|uniref:cell envelope integrity protein TolA n=1 Tax=Vibrio diabolicus TaxID=50719 RepID=UPI002160F73C|nr:cell envelope integrity protein TolA [Vibrio diabolicus]MCS0342916.1 cell envelope integrity protein TolA [Vibrio diabolicus]